MKLRPVEVQLYMQQVLAHTLLDVSCRQLLEIKCECVTFTLFSSIDNTTFYNIRCNIALVTSQCHCSYNQSAHLKGLCISRAYLD